MKKAFDISIPYTIFGAGTINRIGDVAKDFSPAKVLVITDAGLVKAGVIDTVKPPLEKAGVRFDIYDSCRENPTFSSVQELSNKVREGGYDLLIGIGGGSTMDAARMASVMAYTGLTAYDLTKTFLPPKIEGRIIPTVIVPTTSGTGCEWSLGIAVYEDTESGHGKAHIADSRQFQSDVAIIDPELTLTLPQSITAITGMDALTHAVEAYMSRNASVFSDMLATTSLRLIAENIRNAYAKGGQDIDARSNMALANPIATTAVIMAGIGLTHVIDISSYTNIPHGSGLAILLPYVLEFSLAAVPDRLAKIAELMGEDVSGLSVEKAAAKSVDAVKKLSLDLGFPRNIAEIGVTEADIPDIAKTVYRERGDMIPRTCTPDAGEEDIARILRSALQ